jgi:hypothetical protein
MSKFAVAHINWYDHDLTIEIVEAETWHEALFKHTEWEPHYDVFEDLINQGNFNMEEWKQLAFDIDAMFDVVEITER